GDWRGSTYGTLLRQGDHIITLFSMQFLGRPVSPARLRCQGAVATRTAKPGRSRPAATPYRLRSARFARCRQSGSRLDRAHAGGTRRHLRPRKTRGGMENAQCPPTPQVDTTAPGLRWRDVLRSVEEIAGVELALDPAQPRIDLVRKGRAHACVALVLGHEIDIGAAGRERPGGAPIFPRPDEMATILLRALPRPLDVQHVGCRSQADRVHARIETRGGAAEMHQKGGGVRRCDAFGMLDHGID